MVRFLKSKDRYSPGEKATFRPDLEREYVRLGIAESVKTEAKDSEKPKNRQTTTGETK